ncbi:MAG: response regulator [Candidatus Marinimicrobia bacterium]|nr:response regulator [Candidatus Neomarinimicrobiota bacterium]
MGKKRILLIDDKALLRDALKEYLSAEEYSIIEAEDGEIAVRLFKEEEFDLVILDHNLPGMDGLQTLKMLKKHKPEVPVIGLTGELTIQVKEDYLAAGAADIQAKSAIYEKLIPSIESALAGQVAGVSDKKDFISLAEELKNTGRWEESAMYLKEAALDKKAEGDLEKANELFEEAISRYIRAGRRSKAKEVEKLMDN